MNLSDFQFYTSTLGSYDEPNLPREDKQCTQGFGGKFFWKIAN